MSDALESLNGLIIPLTEQGLLLPNVAVAELVAYRLSKEAANAPAWFLGWTQWRDQQVPLIDPTSLLGQAPGDAQRLPRTLILNAVGQRPGVNFIALRVWGIPRSRKVLRGDISSAAEAGGPYVAQAVQLTDEDQVLLIPDLQAMETALAEAGLLPR